MAEGPAATDRVRRPRGPGFAYSALTTVMVVLIGVVAFSTSQPPPPTIAEFAPQALEVIEDAPTEQTSEFGQGGAGQGPGGQIDPVTGLPVPDPTPPPIEVPRVRRCIGDPPRQTEDPQSPPCVPYWEGENGGETYRGVTGNQINIASPINQGRTLQVLQAFFNKRFEFYGRALNIYPGGGGGGNCIDRRNGAQYVAEELETFAALDSYGPSTTCFYDELARRKVIGSTWEPHFADVGEMDRRRPYMWQYPMGYDGMFRNLGRWACARLGGKTAEHAGPGSVGKPRKFGIILQYDERNFVVTTEPLKQELARCGYTDVPERRYGEDRSGESGESGVTDPTLARNAIIEMQTKEVTTVICLCLLFVQHYIPHAATSQAYFPEWVMSSFFMNDTNLTFKFFWPDAEQRSRAMGLTFQPRMRTPADEPAFWAAREIDPEGGNDFPEVVRIYRSLLLVASGIQMAGPNLTPETFERALQRTRFPNPENKIGSGKVGFTDGTHSMTTDAAEMWWSEAGRDPTASNSTGAWCYVDQGRRKALGDWSALQGTPDPFFDPPCFSGA